MSIFLTFIRKNRAAGIANSPSFLSTVSEKAAERTEGINFKDMLKSRYPGAYYNVMDTSKIDKGLWGRNDYPWDAYFKEPADNAVLNWKPTGAEPDMQSPEVQSKINSMAGKMSIVIPQELEEKMKNDPELAQQVMNRIDGFITKYYRPEANQGFLITFDENGEINNACIACEGRITVVESGKDGKPVKKHLEVDFICNKGSKKYYIQSAYLLDTKEKMAQEIRPFLKINDSFKKIVITSNTPKPFYTDDGILMMNVYDFLLNSDSMEL